MPTQFYRVTWKFHKNLLENVLKQVAKYERNSIPSEEFKLTAKSLGAHMKVAESSPGMGHGELILRTFI